MAFSPGLVITFFLLAVHSTSETVILIKDNVSLSFQSAEANFAPRVGHSGICGSLFSGKPLDACTPLNVKPKPSQGLCLPFLVVMRGNCSFDQKVHHAQDAGFAAAIVFNNEEGTELLNMAGNPENIWIYAVFVAKQSGEMLLQFADDSSAECWILPTYENTAWLILVISFVSLLAIAAVLATCVIIRKHRIRYMRSRQTRTRESHGISERIVKALPIVIFKTANNDVTTESTCAICLEDYILGDQLRILPCCHRFHSSCVDSWLTMWRPFCPICKHDAHLEIGGTPASEYTPLLSSSFPRQLHSTASLGAAIPFSPPESPPVEVPSNSLLVHVDSTDDLSCFQNTQHTRFTSAHQLPPRPTSSYNMPSPMVTPYASRHPSMQSLGLGSRAGSFYSNLDPNSIEAFRASPYFTPPSLSRNASGSQVSPYLISSYNGMSFAQDTQRAFNFCGSNVGSPLVPSSPYTSQHSLPDIHSMSDIIER